jgi:hypothetical protein
MVGTGAVFALNAVSFTGVMAVLWLWKRQSAATTLPAERFLSALRTGFRFAWHHGPLHGAVVRGMGFFVFASAPWALLPLIARNMIRGGPQTFGILVASIGAGAVLGALVLPRLRKMLSKDILVAFATVLYALAMLPLAFLSNLIALSIAMVFSGLAWITVLSSLQVAAQLALPDWVRSRGLAVFMATFMGSMAFGSLLWGSVAQHTSITTALVVAAMGAVVTIALTWRWKLGTIEDIDLTPSMHWPSPATHQGVTPDRGPVMVTIAYQVEDTKTDEFLTVVRDLGKRRKRDGAFLWGVMEDTGIQNRFVEYFMVESWLEHLRQHERVTNEDRLQQDRVHALLVAGSKPEISHYVAPSKY